jgi:gamma-D-glutamyl-L-lysine dipeptidyl-peptidase
VRSVPPLVAGLTLLALLACGPEAVGPAAAPPAPAPTTTPAVAAAAPSDDAWVDVAVANLWAQPAQTRPLDAPALANPVEVDRWLASMTVEDRLWLVGRLVTQALYGDRVIVIDEAGGWTKVVVPRQPTSLDARGYPGWLPTAQLTRTAPGAAGGGEAIVTAAATTLRPAENPAAALLQLSFGTRLPVLASDPAWVLVGTPGGGRGRLPVADVAVVTAGVPPPASSATGEQVVETAAQFAGVPYLWGGTSGTAWDCSGLTSAVYAAHGVVIPRDADDQAAAGTAVGKADLQPGDLLFYATGADRESIHHVGIYAGDGRMIQAPATGRTVETVPIDRPGLASRYWGARRYLPSG